MYTVIFYGAAQYTSQYKRCHAGVIFCYKFPRAINKLVKLDDHPWTTAGHTAAPIKQAVTCTIENMIEISL